MSRQFLRFPGHQQGHETLIPVDKIEKIEIYYAGRAKDGQILQVSDSIWMPDTFRVYSVFFGGAQFDFPSDRPSKALEIIEAIYRESVPFGPPSTQS